MSYNYKFLKFYNVDILTFIISIILFFKFFILNEQIPLHDEVTAIERFTEWKNFLRKDGVNNHTLISIYGVLVRSIFGFDLSIFRFVSFFSFVGIIFLFNRIFNNYFYCLLFIFIVFNSNFLFNALNTFRGYYIYAFLSCLIFYFLVLLDQNSKRLNVLRYILILSALLIINALYGLYIAAPTLIAIFFKKFKEKDLYKNGLIYLGTPVICFYLVFFFLDGLVINNNSNLNLDFLKNNFHLILFDNLKTGFINIFNATPDLIKNNHFKSYIYTYHRFLNGENGIIYSKEYIYIFIYILAFIFLLINCIRRLCLVDMTILFMFLFYFVVDKDPFIRVHSGTIYFSIFYIFYNFKGFFKLNLYKNNKKIKNIIICFFIVILTLYQNPDPKWQETKPSVMKIKRTLETKNCEQANKTLSQYEVWIVKNILPNLCNSQYDFDKKINVLF
jgi:hypothetical protein